MVFKIRKINPCLWNPYPDGLLQPICKPLWCTTSLGEEEGCRTQHMPWADGTPCGAHQWCQRGACVTRDLTALQPINGVWGDWQR